jgi:drug/metabolite transporter (DMT)-like permease
VIARALRDDAPPLGLAFWRWLLALSILLTFTWRDVRAEWRVIRAHWPRLAFLGAMGVGCYNTLLYGALQTTTATNGVLIPSFSPVMIAAVAYLAVRERMTPRQWAGIVVSLVGVMLIATRGDLLALGRLEVVIGDWLLLAAALTWAIYTVALRWRPALSSIVFMTVTIAVGAALLLPLYLLEVVSGRVFTLTPQVAAGVAYVAVFPSLLSYLFWNRGVEVLGPNRSGVFINLVPAFGVALAVAVLGETLERFHWIGAALIFSGIALSAAAPGKADAPIT